MAAIVVPFLRDTSFDPETTHILGQAYDCACEALPDVGPPAIVKEFIAKRIIEVAKTGERDPLELCKRALKAVRVRSEPSEFKKLDLI